MSAIKTNNLTKQYGKSRGISDVELFVDRGDFFGFIGPNGAGKSTTIRILLNFIFPTSGSAEIFGLDCVKNSEKIKKSVGYVPSEINFYKNMKVGSFFDYASSFHSGIDNVRRNRLTEALEVDTGKKIGSLSLGNRKKVAIVAALLHSPKLLILDEPTNGLDPLMQNRLFEILNEENKNGVTIFLSSHNLGEVQKHCGKIAFIKEGKIIDVKKTEELESMNTFSVALKSDSSEISGALKNINVNNIKSESGRLEFIYRGNINELVKILANFNLLELKIEEPTLEDTFLHYYEREN